MTLHTTSGGSAGRVAGVIGVALVLASVATGCGGGRSSDPVVAVLDGTPLTLSDLDGYLALNLPESAASGLAPEERDRVLSRLFDSFVEERLLLAEAERSGLRVSPAEIHEYLDDGSEPDDEASFEQLEAVVRDALMVQKFRESYLREHVHVSTAEIDAYLARHRQRLAPKEHVVVRSLRLESAEEARAVRREIARGRMTFAEAVVAHAEGPSQGVALELPLSTLPQEFRTAIEGLRPGAVSGPVEREDEVYLIQLVSADSGARPDPTELRALAREELRRERSRRALDALARDLTRRADLRIRQRNLPFRYVAEPPDS